MNLTALFDKAIDHKASDIHLATGEVPRMRIAGDLVRCDDPPLTRSDFDDIFSQILPADARLRLAAGQPVERSLAHGDFGLSAVVFRSSDDGLAATFRILASGVPPLAVIGVGGMPLFNRVIETPRGFVLMVGPTGSGKWTAACSLVDAINAAKPARIFVIEGSANFRFSSKQGMVTQIRVGEDCESYERALDLVGHADLDVLAVDDIPTAESLRKLLIRAETGDLVIANMHANSVPDAFERLLLAAGPDAEALRRTLARNLVAISAQRLAPRSDQPGRVALYEWMVSTPAVREALLSGAPSRLRDLQGTEEGCQSLAAAAESLVAEGIISRETAEIVCLDNP